MDCNRSCFILLNVSGVPEDSIEAIIKTAVAADAWR